MDEPPMDEPPMDEMGRAPSPLEQRLQAYLDGELSAAEAADVEAMVETSMEAQRILERLTREMAGLRALFDAEAAAIAAARPIELPRGPAPAARPSLGARISAFFQERFGSAWAAPAGLAAAAGLALGVFLGAGPAFGPAETEIAAPTAAPKPPGWRMSAAVYHRLYAEETFASAPVTEGALAGGLAVLGERLGLDLSEIAAPEGLTLERAQLLRFNGRALGQIAFLDAGGVPIALCVMRRRDGAEPTPAEPAFAASMLLDMNAVDWSVGGYDFLLLGAASPDALDAYAKRLSDQLG